MNFPLMNLSLPVWTLFTNALLPTAYVFARESFQGRRFPWNLHETIGQIFRSMAFGTLLSLGIAAVTPSFHRAFSFVSPSFREVALIVAYLSAPFLGHEINKQF